MCEWTDICVRARLSMFMWMDGHGLKPAHASFSVWIYIYIYIYICKNDCLRRGFWVGLVFLRLTFNLNMCPRCAWAKGCVDKSGRARVLWAMCEANSRLRRSCLLNLHTCPYCAGSCTLTSYPEPYPKAYQVSKTSMRCTWQIEHVNVNGRTWIGTGKRQF